MCIFFNPEEFFIYFNKNNDIYINLLRNFYEKKYKYNSIKKIKL
ncbi:hypothetical protein M8044_000380 [Columbia Basin potato purple top phytoplasma]|uniref:Uncharacterized protein n=1 Tax=Columbia Basin potato purple top phytoplasma TaxID=307134 RepID=A0ABT5L975_9MOLU|nr:hypothetical protein [Columbia Basin potato purple top phytoplasma]